MSSWTRTIVVPLAIISALKPVRPIPERLGIAELFRHDLPKPSRRTKRLVSWENVFVGLDFAFKRAEKVLPESWRRPGVRAAHRWMVDHFENTDGLGAIFPPMIYTVIALRSLGYEANDPAVLWAMRQLEDLLIEEDGATRVQPCVSPVWDTAITTIALADGDLPAYHPALLRSVRWLLEREIRVKGDWVDRGVKAAPSGWPFQYRNEFYPDVDDTAMVLLALQRTSLVEQSRGHQARSDGSGRRVDPGDAESRWRLGGLRPRRIHEPGAHERFRSPTTTPSSTTRVAPDITMRVVEMLRAARATGPITRRSPSAVELRPGRRRRRKGCWYGRWGVNYIYGTWQVLQGAWRRSTSPMDHPNVKRVARGLAGVGPGRSTAAGASRP